MRCSPAAGPTLRCGAFPLPPFQALNPPVDAASGLPLALYGETYLLHRTHMSLEAHLACDGWSGTVKATGGAPPLPFDVGLSGKDPHGASTLHNPPPLVVLSGCRHPSRAVCNA
jgi:hypothetical protein